MFVCGIERLGRLGATQSVQVIRLNTPTTLVSSGLQNQDDELKLQTSEEKQQKLESTGHKSSSMSFHPNLKFSI